MPPRAFGCRPRQPGTAAALPSSAACTALCPAPRGPPCARGRGCTSMLLHTSIGAGSVRVSSRVSLRCVHSQWCAVHASFCCCQWVRNQGHSRPRSASSAWSIHGSWRGRLEAAWRSSFHCIYLSARGAQHAPCDDDRASGYRDQYRAHAGPKKPSTYRAVLRAVVLHVRVLVANGKGEHRPAARAARRESSMAPSGVAHEASQLDSVRMCHVYGCQLGGENRVPNGAAVRPMQMLVCCGLRVRRRATGTHHSASQTPHMEPRAQRKTVANSVKTRKLASRMVTARRSEPLPDCFVTAGDGAEPEDYM